MGPFLKTALGLKKEEVTNEWIEDNEEFRNIGTDIMRLIKSVRLDVQAAYMGEINNKHRFRGGGGEGVWRTKTTSENQAKL
jgi:hypothetical protein